MYDPGWEHMLAVSYHIVKRSDLTHIAQVENSNRSTTIYPI
jgi:hypothetical protein